MMFREALGLQENDHCAFLLLCHIVLRARRTDGRLGTVWLKAGQALIGDYKKAGLTAQEYRSAKQRLVKSGFIEISSTPQGTIATLIDTSIFDINAESTDPQQPQFSMKNAHQQQSPNTEAISPQPLTTNQEEALRRTTTPNLFYPCLVGVDFLTEEEKRSLMIFSEERVRLALSHLPPLQKIKASAIQYLQWHCRQPRPPTQARPALGTLIEEYNRWLSDHGYHDLVEQNKTSVQEGHLHVILDGRETTVTLNQDIVRLRNDLDQSRREIEGKSYER